MDTDTGDVHIIPDESNHMGGEMLSPEYLHKNGVRIMICGGPGQKALLMFESYRIQIFVGQKAQ
jgi:predicted Fe-Mo cluster-binding NifX family protein